MRHVPDRAEIGREFHRDRDLRRALYRARRFDVVRFDVLAAHRRVGRDEVHVELERSCTRLFQPGGVGDPTLDADGVQARDDRDVNGRHRAPQRIEVARYAAVVVRHLREVAARLRLAEGAVIGVHRVGRVFGADLLLEQRRHHHRGGAGIFERADAVHRRCQRRRRRNNRMLELQSEIVRRQIHGHTFSQCGRNRLPSRAARSSYSL